MSMTFIYNILLGPTRERDTTTSFLIENSMRGADVQRRYRYGNKQIRDRTAASRGIDFTAQPYKCKCKYQYMALAASTTYARTRERRFGRPAAALCTHAHAHARLHKKACAHAWLLRLCCAPLLHEKCFSTPSSLYELSLCRLCLYLMDASHVKDSLLQARRHQISRSRSVTELTSRRHRRKIDITTET